MRKKKEKLTAQDILDFFAEKLTFDRSETDASVKYGWPSTKEGLYSISDFYRYFEAKEFTHNDVDDVIYKFFQKHDYNCSKLPKMEKGKTHYMKTIYVTNFNPDHKQNGRYMSSVYYFVDISNEKAFELKKEYELDSKKHMDELIEKYNSMQKTVHKSASQKQKEEKKQRKPRTKKTPQIEELTLVELTLV